MENKTSSAGEQAGENLVFIVGSPRSGTTWLQRLLATHPQVQTGQESRVFFYIASQFKMWRQDLASAEVIGRGGTGLACYLNEAEFLAIQRKYLAALLAPMLQGLQPGQIFLEKTPGHAFFIPEIAQLLPAAKIIHLVRDPRDVVASLLAAAKGWGKSWAPRDVKMALQEWRWHVEAVHKAAPQLAPGQFLEICYEDLVAAPASQLRAVSDFLNLAWQDEKMAAAIAANTAGELRQGRGTQIPIYGVLGKAANSVVTEPKNFVRKAQPGSWRQDLTWLERRQLKYYLRRLGREEARFVQK